MIYYSIGNFIFDQPKPLNANACVVKLTVTKERMETQTIPIQIRNCVPTNLVPTHLRTFAPPK